MTSDREPTGILTGWATIDAAIEIRDGLCMCGTTAKGMFSCLRCTTNVLRREKEDIEHASLQRAAELAEQLGSPEIASAIRKLHHGCSREDVLAAAAAIDAQRTERT